jgi:ubiquinone/menaquinone biosynthesis C-methylase UbiE
MTSLETTLAALPIGRVLDAATGRGNFIHTLKAALAGYDEIVGIDMTDKGAAAFDEAFQDDPRIRFEKMDAAAMDFEDGAFDLVSLAYSVHHLARVEPVFAEMRRVVRPGGTILIMEMMDGEQAETQMTHVLLHHWWAAVDRARGVDHFPTLMKPELLRYIEMLECETYYQTDLVDLSEDPKDPEVLDFLDDIIDQYLTLAREQSDDPALAAEGEILRQRLFDVGYHNATALIWLGRKPGGG